jgi:hypothetical protein
VLVERAPAREQVTADGTVFYSFAWVPSRAL